MNYVTRAPGHAGTRGRHSSGIVYTRHYSGLHLLHELRNAPRTIDNTFSHTLQGIDAITYIWATQCWLCPDINTNKYVLACYCQKKMNCQMYLMTLTAVKNWQLGNKSAFGHVSQDLLSSSYHTYTNTNLFLYVNFSKSAPLWIDFTYEHNVTTWSRRRKTTILLHTQYSWQQNLGIPRERYQSTPFAFQKFRILVLMPSISTKNRSSNKDLIII